MDGILRVSAVEKRTGLKRNIVIENALSQFRTEEKERARERVGRLFETGVPGGTGQSHQPLLTKEAREKIVQGKALVEKAEKMFPDIPEEDKEEVINLIEWINDAIQSAEYDSLAVHIEDLSEILFYLGA
jgi:molecular chaperone DnaK